MTDRRTLNVRMSPEDYDEVATRAIRAGLSLSAYTRRALLEWEAPIAEDRIEDVERRLTRLEEMAGL